MPSFTSINGQIKTGLRWYDDERLISMNTAHCAEFEGCEFAQWTPINSLPPFQFWRPSSTDAITSWTIHDSEGNEILDLSGDVSLLSIVRMASHDYIVYNGSLLSTLLPDGIMFSQISDGTNTYYSDLFRTMCRTEGTENLIANGDFTDGLEGFSIGGDVTEALEIETTAGTPSTPCTTAGTVILNTGDNLMYECNGSAWSSRTPAEGRIFYVQSVGSWTIFTGGSFSSLATPPVTVFPNELCWDGPALVNIGIPLPEGPIHIVVSMGIAQGGTLNISGPGIDEDVPGGYDVEYTVNAPAGSELLFTPDASWEGCVVSVSVYAIVDERNCHPKLEWTSCGNIGNTYYEDGFVNVMYLDKNAHVSDPTPRTVIEGVEDGLKNFSETFRRTEVDYRLEVGWVPWCILDALAAIPLHDTVRLTLPNGEGPEELKRVRLETERDRELGGDCLQSATLVFQVDEAAVNTTCCTTFEPPCLEVCEEVSGYRSGGPYTVDLFYLDEGANTYSQYKGFSNGPVDADGFDTRVTCHDGLVRALFGDDPYLYWTGEQWFPLAQITEVLSDDGCGSRITVTANMIARYSGQLQYSTDGGATWTSIGFPHTADEWGSGVVVDDMPPACDLRMVVFVGTCTLGVSDTRAFDCCFSGSLCECVYYQDFRRYDGGLAQNYAIWSFQVNGQEQLPETPPGSGFSLEYPLNTPDTFIQVGGRDFFTNLIDTLNGLEVCGFSFFPHENLRPGPGPGSDLGEDKGGYFRMRYPCSATWQIIIRDTVSGAPAYRYSSADGAEYWAGSAWASPFVYGPWSAGPGEECQEL